VSASLSPLLKQATPVQVASGRGAVVTDLDGREYLDFTSGIGVTSTGHCHPRVVAAAQEQVATLIHGQYTTVMHQPLRRLVERLGDVLPDSLDSVFFANSGSEAVEASLRLARQATGRPNIIAFHGGFHGRTVGAASITTSGAKFRTGFAPLMGGVVIAPYPAAIRLGLDEEAATDFALRELDHILATISAPSDTAAFIIEPVLGEGGYIPTPARFLHGLRERADRHGILLILDEVQTGVGRTGRFWAQEHTGVRGDVLVTAKGIASGFPLSAMAASAGLMAKALPGSQGGTYGANAVACAAAVATLDVIRDEDLVRNSRGRPDPGVLWPPDGEVRRGPPIGGGPAGDLPDAARALLGWGSANRPDDARAGRRPDGQPGGLRAGWLPATGASSSERPNTCVTPGA
jgi:4-aminobutyrate aminotransferase